VIVEADGGARGNPGPAGFGAVVRDAGTGEVLAQRRGALGINTNNVAEYRGLVAGLTAAAELGAREIEVRMDSKLVIEQMAGRWQIKHPNLRPLAAEAAALIRRFETVRLTWIPRERNKDADALANQAMDEAADADRPHPAARLADRRRAGSGGDDREAAQLTLGELVAEGRADPVESAGPAGDWTRPVATATRLLLVRHGQTELTAQRRYSGRGDVPLSVVGQQQADQAARRVIALLGGDSVPPAVYSSPLRRCTATAEAIAVASAGRPAVTSDQDVIECDFGAWEGLTFAEVRAGWPAQLSAWLASTTVVPPGGESMRAVSIRVRRAVGRLRAAHPEQPVIVVSHVTPIKLILRDALGATDALLHRLYLDPAGITVIDLWPDGGVAVRSVNDTAHLAG
jgi:probable phosphoglycerate mutase